MACDPITDIVVRETGRYLPATMAALVFPLNGWARLMPRAEFPAGLGETLSQLIFERSAPYVNYNASWTAVATQDSEEGGQCLPATHTLRFGSTTRTVTLSQIAFNGPPWCAVNLRSAFELGNQIDNINIQMANHNRQLWEQRDVKDYFLSCQYKVVANDHCGQEYSDTIANHYPTDDYGCPTVTLSMGLLNYWKAMLIRNGAVGESTSNGVPDLTVLTDWETLENIKFQNNDYRQDLRYGQPSALLAPMGVPGSYRGFNFLCQPFPRHFTCAENNGVGVLTEVLPFTEVAATKGFKAKLNSSYLTADYTETLIWDRSVCTQLVPTSLTNAGSNFTFSPVDYTGTWSLKNTEDKDCNPDGNIIWHRCVMMCGNLMGRVERGVAIIHKRCDPPCTTYTTCAS